MMNGIDCSHWKISDIYEERLTLVLEIIDPRIPVKNYYGNEIDLLLFIGSTKDLYFSDVHFIIFCKTLAI